MRFRVVIPARYGSQRFPGKVLAPLAGRPMLAHVHARAVASGADEVIVATDDTRVADACAAMGARCEMTGGHHASGTDRIAEVAERSGWDDDELVVNLQGDEPLMPAAAIRAAAARLAADADAHMATLATAIHSDAEFNDANVVKLVTDQTGAALYFSRASIPWHRRSDGREYTGALRHIGLYAYRVGTLRKLAGAAPCEVELAEQLEQLRALWLGYRILVELVTEVPGPSVDTPADLDKVQALMTAHGGTGER